MQLMNYDIFISYRRKDAADYARQIQLKLENYGYTVFLDHDELKDGRFDHHERPERKPPKTLYWRW